MFILNLNATAKVYSVYSSINTFMCFVIFLRERILDWEKIGYINNISKGTKIIIYLITN